MTTQLQLRRGTDAENNAFTGAEGEVTVDTTNKTLRVHDGVTQGGFAVAHESDTAKNDMSNLTNVGKNIANWSSNATNCITEIPQDINIELSSGTLTLKSGSKVYFADGSSYTTTSDKTRSAGASGKTMIVYRKTSNDIVDMSASQCYSGTTQPTGVTYAVWFDTTDNIVKWTSDGFVNWQECSFPVALTTFTGGVPTSIDQVFNGFGYIGSTVFALPNVKLLCPDGRNIDGTLKNNIVTISGVITKTWAYTIVDNCTFIYDRDTLDLIPPAQLFVQDKAPVIDSSIYERWMSPELNECYFHLVGATEWTKVNTMCFLGTGTKPNQVTIIPKTAFHAVDYNDTEFISHQAMPSDRYRILTLPASGSTVTAPADGYYTVNKSGSAGEQIQFVNISTYLNINQTIADTESARLLFPVSKGDTVEIRYTLSGSTHWFRFIYANGVK